RHPLSNYERIGAGYARHRVGASLNCSIIANGAVITLNLNLRRQAQDSLAEAGLETSHYRQHHYQCRYSEHHAHRGEDGGNGYEGVFAPCAQITKCYSQFVSHSDLSR